MSFYVICVAERGKLQPPLPSQFAHLWKFQQSVNVYVEIEVEVNMSGTN